MNINELNEKLETILNKEQINEMSMAWDYRKKSFAVCAWTEGPMFSDNRYFKYYNSDSYNVATKCARIRLDRPEYVGGNHKETNSQGKVLNWALSSKEIKILVELLNSPSIDYDNCTKWQDMLIRWNRDNFGIPAKDTISGNVQNYKAKPGLLDSLSPFDINAPIPDYTKLK